VLGELAGGGWRLGVATSKPTVFAERILEHFDLRAAFEVVSGAEMDGSRQHKHEVIAHALVALGVDPSSDCVMVGDREHDILGGKRLGLSTVGVTWGYGPRYELEAAGADVIVDAIAGLSAYFPRPPGLLLST
jgi:phosphoglycolate phosphatase